MTSPSSDPAADEAATTWKDRARFRWRITVLLGIFAVFLLTLTVTLHASAPPTRCSTCIGASPSNSQPWTETLSALGTLAAGIGALISGIAAILALRAAAAAARNTGPIRKQNATASPPKKPPQKRKVKR